MKTLSLNLAVPLSCAALALAAPAAAAEKKAGTKEEESCAEPTVEQLDAEFAKFNAAWATRNPDTVTELFDDDAVLLATVAAVPRTDHAGIRAYFVDFLKNSPVGRIETTTVKAGCGWALRTGTWTVSMTDAANGAKSDVKARYTFLYDNDDGPWEIEHLHSSVLPAKP